MNQIELRRIRQTLSEGKRREVKHSEEKSSDLTSIAFFALPLLSAEQWQGFLVKEIKELRTVYCGNGLAVSKI